MIGGNVKATIQKRFTSKNEIGESVAEYSDLLTIKGWLDLSSGNSHKLQHKTKTEDSTYMFICDYNKVVRGLDITEHRFVINERIYELKFIDNPMELCDHLEITLKLIGVVNA